MNARSTTAALLIVMGLFACEREESQTLDTPAQDTVRRVVVDSILPVEEEIRRFKAARNQPAAADLGNAALSRDALVARFMKALEARDTLALRTLVIDAAEFIDLYYPSSMYTKPPYKQSPELVWFLMQESGEKGIGRALERYGGVAPNFEGYTCAAEPTIREHNRFWGNCAVRWAPATGAPSPLQLFGAIMERNGRFKFVSYANDL